MAHFNFMALETNPVPSGMDTDLVFKFFSLNNALHKVYWFFQPTEPVTISHLGFLYDIRSGTPPSYRLSLRLTDGSGLPANEILTSRVFTPPPDTTWNGTFRWIEMLTPYKAGRGEDLCAVLEHFSGGINTSHASRVITSISNAGERKRYFPYFIGNVAGVETRNGAQIVFGWKSMTRSYGLPITDLLLDSVNAPAQVGMRFLFHPAYGRTFNISGARIQGRMSSTSGKSFDMVLYDEDNIELNRVTFDCDHTVSSNTIDAVCEIRFDDVTLESLLFGKPYYIAFAPNQADTNFALRAVQIQDTADMTALPGGANVFMVSRSTSSANWTEHEDRRPQVDLLPGEWTE